MKKNRDRKGFTLAELLIVVAIITVLVGISVPIFNRQQEKARDAASVANIRSAYAEAMMAYMEMSADGTTSTKIGGHAYYVKVPNNHADGTIADIYSEPYIQIESRQANQWSGQGDNLPFPWVSSTKGDKGEPGKYRIDIFFNHDGSIRYAQLFDKH